MRIGMMTMPVIMVMRMIMPVFIRVPMMMVCAISETARPCAEIIAKSTIFNVTSRRCCACPLNMMMVGFLRQANLFFKAERCCPVFTKSTIHQIAAFDNFHYPLSKGCQHFGMVIQIACFHKLDIWVFSRNLIGKAINPVYQNAGK